MGASFWSVEVISSLRGRFLHRVSPWLWDPLGLGAELSIKYTCVFQIPWFCGTATENSFLLQGCMSDSGDNTRYSCRML